MFIALRSAMQVELFGSRCSMLAQSGGQLAKYAAGSMKVRAAWVHVENGLLCWGPKKRLSPGVEAPSTLELEHVTGIEFGYTKSHKKHMYRRQEARYGMCGNAQQTVPSTQAYLQCQFSGEQIGPGDCITLTSRTGRTVAFARHGNTSQGAVSMTQWYAGLCLGAVAMLPSGPRLALETPTYSQGAVMWKQAAVRAAHRARLEALELPEMLRSIWLEHARPRQPDVQVCVWCHGGGVSSPYTSSSAG
jgi:hypothetical protein